MPGTCLLKLQEDLARTWIAAIPKPKRAATGFDQRHGAKGSQCQVDFDVMTRNRLHGTFEAKVLIELLLPPFGSINQSRGIGT
jgi:hypothetical protein